MARRRKRGFSTLVIGAAGFALGLGLGYWWCSNYTAVSAAPATTAGLGRWHHRRWRRLQQQGGGSGGGGGGDYSGALLPPDPNQTGMTSAYDTSPDFDEGYD